MTNQMQRFFMWCWWQVLNLSVIALCTSSVTLIMFGVGVLELERKVEFFVFVAPTSWVTFLNCYFIIKAMGNKTT